MIEISSLVVLIVAEMIVGLVALSGFLLLTTLLRKGRIRKAAVHLADRVQSDKAKREQRLKGLLQERYKLTDTELEQTLHNIVRMEMMLYQNVINGFLKDDQVYLQQLDVDVENLVTSYQELDVPDSASSTQQVSGEDGEEILKLREENEKLSEELRVTMDTMGRMLNEYSTMFSGGAVDIRSATAEAAGAAAEDQQLNEDMEEEVEPEVQESSEESPAPAESTEVSGLTFDTEIPDLSTEELAHSSHLLHNGDMDNEDSDSRQSVTANVGLGEDGVETDEEVSEIIDEVMVIADEMLDESEVSAETETETGTETQTESKTGESMVDDLENIDIEIPVEDGSVAENTEFEAGSLEEEWAKLLEEDAENSKKEGQDP